MNEPPDQRRGATRRSTAADAQDPWQLRRFLSAQNETYARALAELKSGQKRSHWMWFIFPQIHGLGSSETARCYAIKSREEARQYLAHPVLGTRLVECARVLLGLVGRSASEIFGYPDDLKLRSCMTLFASVAAPGSVFAQVLDKYYQGQGDARTLELLEDLDR